MLSNLIKPAKVFKKFCTVNAAPSRLIMGKIEGILFSQFHFSSLLVVENLPLDGV